MSFSENNEITFFRKKVAFRFITNRSESGKFYCGIEYAKVIESTLNDKNPRYDWKNKIFFSLNFSEISVILGLFNDSSDLSEKTFFHNKDSFTKVMKIKRMDNGNLLFSIDYSSSDKDTSIKGSPCLISLSDIPALKVSLEFFIVLMIGKI